MLLRAIEQFEKRDGLSIIGDVSALIRETFRPTESSDTGVRVTEQSAMTLPWAYSAINVLSDTLAHVPLELRQKTKSGGSVPAVDHIMYDLVHNNPSANMTSFNWRKTMEAHRDGWGNGYTWIRRRSGTMYASFELLMPDRTDVKFSKESTDILYETKLRDDSTEQILAIDMLHVPCMTFDGVVGMSPPAVLKSAFQSGLNMQRFGNLFFGQGANPKAIIESDLGGNNYSERAKEFKKAWGGLDNAHGTPVLPKGFTYKPITINPEDAQFLETMKFNRSVIAGIYRVPAHLINDQEKNTFTNAVEMDLSFAKHSMVPIYTAWEQELNRKLLTPKERADGYFFKFNMNALLRGAQKDRFEAYHYALQDGWMTRNQVRRLEDQETDDPMLDEYLMPANMLPASQLVQPVLDATASRIARQEVKALTRCGEDTDAVSKFYQKQRDWLRDVIEPLVMIMERTSGVAAETISARFIERHITKQLGLMDSSVAEAIPEITAASIIKTFNEVTDNERD